MSKDEKKKTLRISGLVKGRKQREQEKPQKPPVLNNIRVKNYQEIQYVRFSINHQKNRVFQTRTCSGTERLGFF